MEEATSSTGQHEVFAAILEQKDAAHYTSMPVVWIANKAFNAGIIFSCALVSHIA